MNTKRFESTKKIVLDIYVLRNFRTGEIENKAFLSKKCPI